MNVQQASNSDGSLQPDRSEALQKYSTFGTFEKYADKYNRPDLYIANALHVSDSEVGGHCSDPNSTNKTATNLDSHTLGAVTAYVRNQKFDGLGQCGATGEVCEDSHAPMPDPSYNYASELFGFRKISAASDPYNTIHVDDSLNGLEIVPNSNFSGYDQRSDFITRTSQLEIGSHATLNLKAAHNEKTFGGSAIDMCSAAMQWRDPNLSEVISFLSNPSNTIRANAAAYLQHLCYMDDPNKQRARNLGAIPPLIKLLSSETPEIYKNACGALRNISYGRQNDENKRAIQNAGGIYALVYLLSRSQESEVKELVTGVLWNLSSCEEIKPAIISAALTVLMRDIIKPHSGWDAVCSGDTCYSTVFRNASGVLRNVSSAGEHARSSLRNCESLIDCLLYVIRCAIERNNIGNKTVENCVCILRNLSYRCQEVEDPNYDKHPTMSHDQSLSSSRSSKGEHLGCFGTNKRKKETLLNDSDHYYSSKGGSKLVSTTSAECIKGYEKLWQPEVVQYYLSLLQSCSNPETLEAAAGAIQNLAACYWQPSIDIRATVRKEKGLPILVELLRMEVDRVVCAVATALRNLAIDQRNKELIGKYAMRDLVQKLPTGNIKHDHSTSDETITAVLATINEVIKKNPEFSRSLLEAGGVERLMNIINVKEKYTCCVLKFACQVLYNMWQHPELRDVYKRNGWKEHDFINKSITLQNSPPNSPNNVNNTLNRPMASQSRTRYEDRTIQRLQSAHHNQDAKGPYSLPSNETSANHDNNRKQL